MALRAKGLSLDFSGFRQANELVADTGRVKGEGLMRLGAGIGAGIKGFRADREKAADKERANARLDRAERREDDRMAAVVKNQERDDAYRRDKDALAWLEGQHKQAFGQLQEVMLHGQTTPDLQGSDAWKSARAEAASRERDLATKVATVRARLSGMQPGDVMTPEPVQSTYDLGIGGEEPQGETDEARVLRLGEKAGRLRRLAAGSKGAASVLYGGLATQAEAELGLAKSGVRTRAKDAETAARVAADRESGQAAADDFLAMIPGRPDWKGVPGPYKARVMGALQNSREGARFGIQDAIQAMNDAAKATPERAGVMGTVQGQQTNVRREAQGLDTAGGALATRRKERLADIAARSRSKDEAERRAAQRDAFDEIEGEWSRYGENADFTAFDPRDLQAFARTRNPQGALKAAIEKGLAGRGATAASPAPDAPGTVQASNRIVVERGPNGLRRK